MLVDIVMLVFWFSVKMSVVELIMVLLLVVVKLML